MTFEEYCISKKIDASKFISNEASHYLELKAIFDQMSEKSFSQQKLFLINKTRRKYPYQEV